MKLFHYLDEGDWVQPGISIYRPGNTHSIGGTLRIGRVIFRSRWSKHRQKFFVNLIVVPAKIPDWMVST